MVELSAFKFLHPGWLALLPPIWLLLWMYSRQYQRRTSWEEVCDAYLLQRLAASIGNASRATWLISTIAAVVTLGIMAAAGPSWKTVSHPLLEPAGSRVLVLDLSRSMLAEDIKPSRFERAAAKAKDIVSEDFEGQTALVVFAGAAFVVAPLTDDKRTLLGFLNALDPSSMPVDGSRLDLSIQTAQRLLEASIDKVGQIIVLSDGASSVEAAINAAMAVRDQGHRLSILAIGTAEGAPLLNEDGQLDRDSQGNLIVYKAGLGELETIAAAGNGRLVQMTESDEDIRHLLAGSAAEEFVQPPKSDQQSQSLQTRGNQGIWLVWLMLPLALALFRRNALWIVLLTTILPVSPDAYAINWDVIWKNKEQRAFEAYGRGEYERVVRLSDNPPLKGAAYFRTQNYAKAAVFFQKLNTAESLYNFGNALANQEKFLEAALAYAEALALNPAFKAAAHNKRLIDEYLALQSSKQGETPDDENEDGETDELPAQLRAGRLAPGQTDQPVEDRLDSTEAGVGAGPQRDPGLPDDAERYAVDEAFNEQFALREQALRQREEQKAIDLWIDGLATDPSDLLRRIFFRDYQRRTGQR